MEMQHSAELTQALIDASIDCVAALDLEGIFTYWNNACELHSGLSREAVCGKPIHAIFPESTRHAHLEAALRHVAKGHRFFFPAEKDAWFSGYFEVHLVPLQKNGGIYGCMLIAHDVAHRVKAERELQSLNQTLAQKYAELEAANSALATYTNLTSQDLKDPLRKIYSTLEKTVIEEGSQLSNKSRSNIRRIQSSVQRLGLLADSLISVSEPDADELQEVPLHRSLQEAIAMLRPRLKERAGTIEAGPGMPHVRGSERQLRMLFHHLLSYALGQWREAAPPKMTVTAAGAPEVVGGKPCWTITISVLPGEGGIEAPALPEDGPAGSGVNLALARKIAFSHGGSIEQETTAAAGAPLLHCYLPAVQTV